MCGIGLSSSVERGSTSSNNVEEIMLNNKKDGSCECATLRDRTAQLELDYKDKQIYVEKICVKIKRIVVKYLIQNSNEYNYNMP